MNYYHYPHFLLRFPQLIKGVFIFNWLTQQRKWLIFPAIHQRLQTLPAGSLVADLGCGEGQFLFPFAHRYPHIRFLAVDQSPQNISFINAYSQKCTIQNISTLCSGIENICWTEQPDFAWCVGVMQYIPDDTKAISKMGTCKELLLYQPIQKKIETFLYRWILKTFPDYDSVHSKQRIYTEAELLNKLQQVFTCKQTKHYYGKTGRIAHEWMSGLGNMVFHGNLPVKFFSLVLLVATYPFILIAMFIDSRLAVQNGNGILVYCVRKEHNGSGATGIDRDSFQQKSP